MDEPEAELSDRRVAALSLAGCYAIHELSALAVRWFMPSPFVRPIRWLPFSLVSAWDSRLYEDNFHVYRRFAWPPLYTETLRLVASVLGFGPNGFKQAALVVNLLSHVAIAWLLVRLVRNDEPSLKGHASTLARALAPALLLLWPFHNAYFAAYSESMFVALAAGTVLAYRRERFVLAGVLVSAALMTRVAGSFLVFGLLFDAAMKSWRSKHWVHMGYVTGALGLATLVGWNAYLRIAHGIDAAAAQKPWVDELVRMHVPPGVEPRVWVAARLLLLAVPYPLAVWGAIAYVVHAARRKRYLDVGWLGSYLASFAVHVYRPFSVPRVLSTFFCLTNWLALALRRRPRLALLIVLVFAIVSIREQGRLFSMHGGEP